MSEDRLTVLEDRLAAVEHGLAELRAEARRAPWKPFMPTDPNDPLKGHPLICPKMPPDVAAEWEARRQKELGLEGVELIDAATLRQMLIDAGWDPTSNEASREIIEAREE